MAISDTPFQVDSRRYGAVVLRRLVNDEICLAAEDGEPVEFACECGDRLCDGVVRMTLTEYLDSPLGSVRAHPVV